MNAFPSNEFAKINGAEGVSQRLLVAALVLPQIVALKGVTDPAANAAIALVHADYLIAQAG